VHYHFVTKEAFDALKDAGEFLEHAHVHGHWYATSSTWLRTQVAAGQDVLLEIDWQVAAQVRRLMPDSVHIFILPPSLDVLKERLEKRGQDSAAVIRKRLAGAREEMRHWAEFDYVIINQDFAIAVDDAAAIVRATRLKSGRQGLRHARLLDELLESPDDQI
jgi:guanylate kinase